MPEQWSETREEISLEDLSKADPNSESRPATIDEATNISFNFHELLHKEKKATEICITMLTRNNDNKDKALLKLKRAQEAKLSTL